MSDLNNNAPLENQNQYTNASTPSMPDNNLVWAILCTAMCCVPLGIVAIIKASEVEKLWTQGEYDKAQKAADDAKKWSLIGAGAFAAFLVLYIVFIACCALFGLAAEGVL